MAKKQDALGFQDQKRKGPVECLGMKFDNDEARREHFLNILREKLQDPEFRKIEGFPIGEDEDILALSDPPYYTACPSPFIEDFIRHYGKPYDADTDDYQREPFATNVSEGRHTWLYKAHTYHTKVPPKALVPYIEHYADPGSIVLDGFCGSGMTGIAGAMADPSRTVVMCDLSPAASFIASTYSASVDPVSFASEAQRIIAEVDNEFGWMYTPVTKDGKGWASYYVWSDVFLCNSCGQEIIFADAAFDREQGEFRDSFPCPDCRAENSKAKSERAVHTVYDPLLSKNWTLYKQVPVWVAVLTGKRRKKMYSVSTENESPLQARISSLVPPPSAHRFCVPMLFRDGQWGDQWKNCLHLRCITHAHQFFTLRQLYYIAAIRDRLDLSRPEHRALLFALTSVMQKTSRLMVYNADGIGRVQKGTLYISSVWQEMRPTHMLGITVDDLLRAVKEGMWQKLPEARHRDRTAVASFAGSSTALPVPDKSVDYVFVDPPFGANIPYSEVNFIWECALGAFTNTQPDALESSIQGKTLADYQALMTRCLSEFHRVLKPGRWITVEFHNSKNSVWAAIQEALLRAGFVVADVRFLDKKQKTFKQATTAGAVKTDLVISAYKPDDDLERDFRLEAGTEKGVWDFIRAHLRQLPPFVAIDGRSEIVAERQDYLLFDRMVAFHVQRGVTVPQSATEFYAGLRQRFPERDGMFFLPEQVSEYDRKRLSVKEVLQLQLFVTDESSAIQWLRQQLTKKPQTFQELQPQFMQEVKAWLKHEKTLELSEMLAENYLCYAGHGEVPSPIHAYLSSNYHELRSLPKDHPDLTAKARDRWYVPDPNREGDLEKIRLRALMKEFEDYQATKGKLKVVRTEALRAGFKQCWQDGNYTAIVDLAKRLPSAVIEEDPALLMYYDNALLRTEG